MGLPSLSKSPPNAVPEIENFINTLTLMISKNLSINKSLSPEFVAKSSSMNKTLVHILFVLKKMVYDTILKNQTFYISLHANKIMEQDAQFFYDRPQIFGELPKEDVNIFRDIYTGAGLTDNDKDTIWASLKSFLILSSIYQGKYNKNIVDRFTEEMETFFQLLHEHCIPNKERLLNQVEQLFREESEDYPPEVSLMCVACQLLPNENLIKARNREFFKENKNGFLVRDNVSKDWLDQILPEHLDEEAANYIWGYIFSLKNLTEQFVPGPERYT